MGKVRILNHNGDDLLVVEDSQSAEQSGGRRVTAAEARQIVEDHVANGGLAYVRKPDGNEQVRGFDPAAEETVLAPNMQGG